MSEDDRRSTGGLAVAIVALLLLAIGGVGIVSVVGWRAIGVNRAEELRRHMAQQLEAMQRAKSAADAQTDVEPSQSEAAGTNAEPAKP